MEPVEPFRTDRSELLVLVVWPIEQFLDIQGLLVNLEDMYRHTIIAKDLRLPDLVSDGDLEHSAWGCFQIVRTLPVQNCSMEHLHWREAAMGSRTYENLTSWRLCTYLRKTMATSSRIRQKQMRMQRRSFLQKADVSTQRREGLHEEDGGVFWFIMTERNAQIRNRAVQDNWTGKHHVFGHNNDRGDILYITPI